MSEGHQKLIAWGKNMTAHYGYSYQLIDVSSKMAHEYNVVKNILNMKNAKRGETIVIDKKIVFFNQF